MAALSILDGLEHLILVRGPLRAVIEQKAREVLRDFLQFTRAWQFEVNDSVFALVSDYDIELPFAGASPIGIQYMSIDGSECVAKDTAWLDRMIPDWRTRSADDFRYYTQLTPGQFTFPCVPKTNGTVGGLYYRASFRPSVTATTFDDSTLNEWGEEIAAGVRAKLYGMVGEPWHHPEAAEAAHKTYVAGRGRARIRASKSYGASTQQWVGPRFA